jgi:hypothetical protein
MDDHDNVEGALPHTVSGGTVRLVPGTYEIGSPILVPDFDGRLVGAANRARSGTAASDPASLVPALRFAPIQVKVTSSRAASAQAMAGMPFEVKHGND